MLRLLVRAHTCRWLPLAPAQLSQQSLHACRGHTAARIACYSTTPQSPEPAALLKLFRFSPVPLHYAPAPNLPSHATKPFRQRHTWGGGGGGGGILRRVSGITACSGAVDCTGLGARPTPPPPSPPAWLLGTAKPMIPGYLLQVVPVLIGFDGPLYQNQSFNRGACASQGCVQWGWKPITVLSASSAAMLLTGVPAPPPKNGMTAKSSMADVTGLSPVG